MKKATKGIRISIDLTLHSGATLENVEQLKSYLETYSFVQAGSTGIRFWKISGKMR